MKCRYEKNYTVGPSDCDHTSRMGMPATFEAFMDIASEHAESLNIGVTFMKETGLFWLTAKTRVSISGSVKANADFTGCDLGEIADFARNQGMEIKKDFSGIKVESITFASSGESTVNFSSGQSDVADCDFSSLDKGILKYAWKEASALGYEIANGNSKVEFNGDNCVLTLQSAFEKDSKKYDVSVIFVMAEKK